MQAMGISDLPHYDVTRRREDALPKFDFGKGRRGVQPETSSGSVEVRHGREGTIRSSTDVPCILFSEVFQDRMRNISRIQRGNFLRGQPQIQGGHGLLKMVGF